jgi:hypothetical protein
MKLVYSPSANAEKSRAIAVYPGLSQYFDELEREIVENPCSASQEKLLINNGTRCTTYKRSVKTLFFSGMLPDAYLFITLNYAITTDERIVVLNVSVHDYAS